MFIGLKEKGISLDDAYDFIKIKEFYKTYYFL